MNNPVPIFNDEPSKAAFERAIIMLPDSFNNRVSEICGVFFKTSDFVGFVDTVELAMQHLEAVDAFKKEQASIQFKGTVTPKVGRPPSNNHAEVELARQKWREGIAQRDAALTGFETYMRESIRKLRADHSQLKRDWAEHVSALHTDFTSKRKNR